MNPVALLALSFFGSAVCSGIGVAWYNAYVRGGILDPKVTPKLLFEVTVWFNCLVALIAAIIILSSRFWIWRISNRWTTSSLRLFFLGFVTGLMYFIIPELVQFSNVLSWVYLVFIPLAVGVGVFKTLEV